MAMVQVVKPQIGERIYDGACGSAGFLCESFDYLTDEQIEDLTAYIQTLGRNVNWRKDKDGNLLNDYEE